MDIKGKKSVQAINYFARKEHDNQINRLKLMKLLWLSDRFHLWKHGRLILTDKYVAMPHGPVPSSTMNISTTNSDPYVIENIGAKGYIVYSKNEVDTDYLSKTEVNVMDTIWEKFGEFDRFELKDISHEYPEWLRYGNEVEKKKTSIPMVMDDFFSIPDDEESSYFDIFKELQPNLENSKKKYSMQSIFSKENPVY